MSAFFSRTLPLVLVAQFFTINFPCAAQPVIDKIPIHEAFVTKFTDPMPNQPVSRPPPLLIRETIPPQPTADSVWISGYWSWIEEDQDYAWVCGVWRRPPPQHHWISGAWLNQRGSWVWAQGFWSPVPVNHLTFIPIPPPQSIDDKVPPSPGNNYFWIRGYWQYAREKNDYIWLSGTWSELNPNWILAPASYIWRPEGYVFVPMYWDFPLEKRGNAYSCSVFGPLMVISPEVIIQRLFVWFPDHIFLYWHWWHFHPNWWGNCWCFPPWWHWHGWWAMPWADLWGLWWWWGHPGFFPPFWVQVAFSEQLLPPSWQLIKLLENVSKPNFPYKPGNKPLLPEGSEGSVPLPKPEIRNDVTPDGQVTPPTFPRWTPPTIEPPLPQVIPPPPPLQWEVPPRHIPPRRSPGQNIPPVDVYPPSIPPERRSPIYQPEKPHQSRPIRPITPPWEFTPRTSDETPEQPPSTRHPGNDDRPRKERQKQFQPNPYFPNNQPTFKPTQPIQTRPNLTPQPTRPPTEKRNGKGGNIFY